MTSKTAAQKPQEKIIVSDSEESFASLNSDDDGADNADEPKVLESDDELLKKTSEKQTSIMLKLQDSNVSFKYPSSRTVQQLINYIYRNYLVQTGSYSDGRNRYALLSKVHNNKCLTTLNQSQNLEEANIHPSIVLFHNTVEKE